MARTRIARNKSGATIDELSQSIGVTRTAVRRHLAALMRDALVIPGAAPNRRPSRATLRAHRPKELDTAGLRVRPGRIASAVVAQLQQRMPGANGRRQKVEQLAEVMDELGYDAHTTKDVGGAPTIEADNCIFHEVAMKNPEICQFDLALLSGFTGSKVELHECMARAGHVCRFRFTARG